MRPRYHIAIFVAFLLATVAVTAQVQISVSPRRAPLTLAEKQQFTKKVSNTSNQGVTWRVDGIVGGSASSGTISPAGLYAAPTAAGSHTVTAQSVADPTKQASANVWVTDYPGMMTWHGDKYRSGVNYQELALTPARVNAASFGKLFNLRVDGQVYAQPLHLANLNIGGAVRNVLFVATEHDSVYAFDADGRAMAPLWKRSFLTGGATTLQKGANALIAPEMGITSTPVIDVASRTLYVEVLTVESGVIIHRLHALSITSGAEKFGGPITIAASYKGSTFLGSRQLGRSALLLLNGTVFVAYSSFGDALPYQGWVMAYTAKATGTIHQAGVFAAATSAAAIWMSGAGPAADSQGNLYLITGNGNFDLDKGGSNAGDTFLKLTYANNAFGIADWFTPFDQATLQSNDWDLGSGGVMLPPTQPGAAPNLAIGGGKEGVLYLVNRDNMGHFNASNDAVAEKLTLGAPYPTNPIFFTPAAWTSYIYTGVVNEQIQAYQFAGGLLRTTPTSASQNSYGYPGATPMISANKIANGILWAIDNAGYVGGTLNGAVNPAAAAVLHAYNAQNLGQELYNSGQSGSRDTCDLAIKYTLLMAQISSPTIANGHVYVGGASSVTVYGPLP